MSSHSCSTGVSAMLSFSGAYHRKLCLDKQLKLGLDRLTFTLIDIYVRRR